MTCSAKDEYSYYGLSGLTADTDYIVESPLSSNKFKLNICAPVRTQLWNVHHMEEDQVGAFYRGKGHDFAMGTVNSTISIVDGNPVIYLENGSPCPNAGDAKMQANTVIRFICEQNRFTAGAPKLIAQFPSDDDHACSFYFEWRTYHACPSGKTPAGTLHLFIIFISFILITLLVYISCVTLYNRFFLGLRGWDQFPSIPWLSPTRFFSWAYDKITGRGDGIVGGPGLRFSSSTTGSRRWGFGSNDSGASKWRWGKWGRRSNSNGYGRIPEEEEGILGDNGQSDDEEGDAHTPRPVNPNGIGFDNAWAGARSSRDGMDREGVIRL